MIGGDGVYHVGVELGIVVRKFHALRHHGEDMVELVGGVEMMVVGQDFALNVCFQLGIYHWVHHLLESLAGRAVAHIYHSAAAVAQLVHQV